MIFNHLPGKFFLQDSLTVAKELLGKVLVKISGDRVLAGKIVETEAYMGDQDPGSHAYNKFTERNKVMYDRGGLAYIYFIYGNYYCFNVVCENKGTAGAVLIRALEPLEGTDSMELNRGKIRSRYELTNGPAKLCLAFNIDKKLYGEDLTNSKEIFISDSIKKIKYLNKEKFEIVNTLRIGLRKGSELPYRYFIKDNPYVTKHKFNKI